MDAFLSIDFLKFIIPLLGAVFAWFWNEKRKRVAEEYSRKEKKYEALIEGLRGFYDDVAKRPEGKKLQEQFLLELNKAWLYCPDDVIRKAYRFLAAVKGDKDFTEEERKAVSGELMVAIRKDLLERKPVRKTLLNPQDFETLKASV
jgi:hypothetical protein